MPRKGDKKTWAFQDPFDPKGMPLLLAAWVESLITRSYAKEYVHGYRAAVSDFILFCQERGITKAQDVTKPVIERYQRFLFYFRKARADGEEGEPLHPRTQVERLSAVKAFFRWLTKQRYLLANPASEVDLPKLPPRRPPEIFTLQEVEKLLATPSLDDPLGIRDRAILETFYSTGLRRRELARLLVTDIDHAGEILRVRHGKGKRERIIPIGERALAFVERYVRDVRPELAPPHGQDDGTLFLTATGKPFWPDTLTQLVRDYLEKAGIKKPGACHLFRHTMATLMLEGGADIRFIQQMLGHTRLDTTTIYTHVAIGKLKKIHTATHPGAKLGAPRLDEPVDDERPAGEDEGE